MEWNIFRWRSQQRQRRSYLVYFNYKSHCWDTGSCKTLIMWRNTVGQHCWWAGQCCLLKLTLLCQLTTLSSQILIALKAVESKHHSDDSTCVQGFISPLHLLKHHPLVLTFVAELFQQSRPLRRTFCRLDETGQARVICRWVEILTEPNYIPWFRKKCCIIPKAVLKIEIFLSFFHKHKWDVRGLITTGVGL